MNIVDEAKAWLVEVGELLETKNKKYGDSATNPIRIFSTASVEDGLRSRIDDKLSRIARGARDEEDEDVLLDLAGYVALLAAVTRIKERLRSGLRMAGTRP